MSSRASVPFTTTLEVRDTCLCLHLQRAARAVARRFDDKLRRLGLTNGQFSLLMSLNGPETPTIGSVATLLAMERTTLTACCVSPSTPRIAAAAAWRSHRPAGWSSPRPCQSGARNTPPSMCIWPVQI
jgi:hypothetical protein